MDRRRFLKQSAAATTAVIGSGLMLSSCKRDLRSDLMGMDSFADKTGGLDPETRKILFYASLAPSGHNAQPWMVKIIDKTQWIIGSDSSRWLRHVDEANREPESSLFGPVHEADHRIIHNGRPGDEAKVEGVPPPVEDVGTDQQPWVLEAGVLGEKEYRIEEKEEDNENPAMEEHGLRPPRELDQEMVGGRNGTRCHRSPCSHRPPMR